MVSGGITVLCRHIHTIAHGESDAFCLAVLTCGQGGRPTVKHFAIGHCGLVQRHGHCCAFRYRVGLFVAGHDRVNDQRLAVFFHSNNAAGYGQRVADRSFVPTGIEGGVLRNCGFVHIKELAILAIFGVPAGELVTRTGGIINSSQFVCLGTNDFFGLINRHLRVVGLAAIGIKGHMAEAKKLVSCQCVSKLIMCGALVFVGVDDTFRRTFFQMGSERSKSSRERNGFQMIAIVKGLPSNGCYIFRDGDVRQCMAISKGTIADRRNIFA